MNSNQQIEYYKQLYLQEKKKNDLLTQNNEKLKNELNSLQHDNQMLQNQIRTNNNHHLTFTEALNMHLANSILGNTNTDSNIDLGKTLSDEIKENPDGFCNSKFFSWNCCFAKNTKILTEKNGKTFLKNIQDIVAGDMVLTLFNGEKKFTKVKYKKNYDDEYKFYEFKCVKGDLIKTITVTHNHIMMAYDKEMNKLTYKTAENIKKNEDYFNTIDGLYEVKEIKIFNMKYKYALGVDEGSIIADDILVTCLNMNDFDKNLSLNSLKLKYNISIM
jgi:hypothetical protein